MGKIRRNFRIFLFNLAALAGFEFLFKVLTTVVLFPAFIRGMNAMILPISAFLVDMLGLFYGLPLHINNYILLLFVRIV